MSDTLGSTTRPGRAVRELLATASSPRRMAIAIVLVFGLSSVFALAQPSSALGWDAGAFSSSSEAALVSLTNRARANAGLRSLKVDSRLTSVARWRSKDMITRDYFSHTIPGYGKVWDKLHAIGYCYVVAGENIGWNTYPDDIATAADPGHVHGLARSPRQHPGQDLGRRRDRRLQGPDRQEDVDRPVRRQVRLDRPEGDPPADRQAEAQAGRPPDRASDPARDAPPDPAQDTEADRRRRRRAQPRSTSRSSSRRPRSTTGASCPATIRARARPTAPNRPTSRRPTTSRRRSRCASSTGPRAGVCWTRSSAASQGSSSAADGCPDGPSR